MTQLTFQQLQSYLALKYKGRSSSSALFMKLVEEVGEVAEVLNQLEGRKDMKDAVSLEKELADLIHYVVALASIHEIDLSAAIVEKDREAAVKYGQSPNLAQFLALENR